MVQDFSTRFNSLYLHTTDNEDDVLHALKDGNMSILCDNYNDAELKIQNVEIIDEINKTFSIKRKENWDMTGMRTPKLMKEKKNVHTFTNEDDIKIQRIKYIMDQEKEMADIQKANEEKLDMMKEELHALEMRAALAKAELAELQLQNEKERLKKTYA
ncbi:hypothetical protein RF55_8187 [Lasius niger]|uniref:Uncharacterized protein n=1 Tax=Lasius niger TaxID=67767 RepID=A0A0J7NHA7_LASNI|nr:hypothetical protein RF55_8187 [Lasius niger]